MFDLNLNRSNECKHISLYSDLPSDSPLTGNISQKYSKQLYQDTLEDCYLHVKLFHL